MSNQEEITLILERTIRELKKFHQREIAKRGFKISGEQYSLMKACMDQPGIRQNMASEKIHKDPASVTRMIDLLEGKGYIQRKRARDDRRAYGLYLTERGEEIMNSILPLVAQMNQYALKNIKDKDAEVMTRALEQIYKNVL